MSNILIDVPAQFFSVAGFTAIATLAYLIGNNRTKRPYFDFIFSYSMGTYNTSTDEYNWQICGIIKNRSLNENSIIKIHRVVWKNKKKNSYLADSLANITIKDRNTNDVQYLPLYFLKKQAINLEISTKFIVRGTPDELILRERQEIAPHLFLPKHKYELVFEDIEGNFFDQYGQLVNMKEADLWWTIVNTFSSLQNWNPIPFINHTLLIIISKISFSIKRALWNLGI